MGKNSFRECSVSRGADTSHWYRSSVAFYCAAITGPVVLSAIFWIVLAVLVRDPATGRNECYLIGGIAGFFLIASVVAGGLASLVHVNGDNVVVQQVWRRCSFDWADIEGVSRLSVYTTRYRLWEPFGLRVAGYRGMFVFAQPDRTFFWRSHDCDMWLDFEFYATTPRDEWGDWG